MSDKALLIIDMLNDFVNEGAPLEVPGGRNIIPIISKMLNFARSHDWSVIYLADNHKKTDPEFEIWPAHCIKGSKGAEVVKELSPKSSEIIIPKRRYSGFFGTDLDLWLRELGVKTIVLTGLVTNICVMYTSADASARGFEVVVVKDGTVALDPKDHEWALKQMETVHNAKILLEEDIEKELG